MRYVIVVLSLICISFSTSPARAHLSAGVDPATFTEEANQTTEDQIGLNRVKRRDVQRRLTEKRVHNRTEGVEDVIPPCGKREIVAIREKNIGHTGNSRRMRV